MPRLKHKLPSYCRHKASGQAVVTIDGRDVYLGPHGSAESKQKYEQQIARWLASRETPTLNASSETVPRDDLRISELLVAYFEHADAYYVKNGAPTGEVKNLEDAVRPLREMFENERVVDFGPVSLKTVRQAMISAKLSRRVINARVNRIRRVFKWGVENELVGPEILHALQAVAPLKKGRSSAPERREVKPVPQQHIDAVRALVSSPVRAMIDLQLLTGMRPGEVVIMRPRDIDRTDATWKYAPSSHKTEHHGAERAVFLGPKAKRVLVPFLARNSDAYLFDPREAMAEKHRERRDAAKITRPVKKLRKRPNPRLGDHYTRKAYHNAIFKACRKAGVPVWGPNRLRHNAATELRKQFGIEVARVILGHRSAEVTEVYAELDRSRASDIMAQVG
jgi:integrase